MPKSDMQKLKLLHLLKIFEQETNESHGLTMPQIIEKLSGLGIKAERKSVYSDIEYLRAFGADIICEKTDRFRYFMASRTFDAAELKMLTDSVLASKSITYKKSVSLAKKLTLLTDVYEAKKLRDQMFFAERVKAENEAVLYNIDAIYDAIGKKKQITFKYFEYTPQKKKQYRNDGNLYCVSPYALTVSEDNYYMVAYYPKREKISSFRVDRMSSIEATDAPCFYTHKESQMRDIIAEFIEKNFKMYTGQSHVCELVCENSVINAVIDRFGEEVQILKEDDEHFLVHAKVTVSPTFFAWVFTFGGKIKIKSPKEVKDEFDKTIKAFL